ncbi:MAG: hypothetical protein ABIP90_10795, partial [Vicinamibacterales bacterium]
MAKPPMSGPPEKNSIQSERILEGQVAASAVALALFFAIILPTTLTLSTVREEVVRNAVLKLEATDNPTPLGYTVSLLIYLIPIATLVTWFYRAHAPGSFRRVALHRTLLTLVPIGFALDFLLGNLIFLFPNTGAILGIYGPGYSFVTHGLVWDIPIEEFIFYVSGFLAILLAYIWNNQVWVSAYGVADYSDTRKHPPYVVQIHWGAAGIGVVLFALALFYKKVLAPVELRDGFPLYMTFLLLVAIIPGMLLHRCAQPFINWRAFGITLMWVLL